MMEQINSKITKEKAAYKAVHRKYKIAEGNDRQIYLLKMNLHIKNLNKLLKEKRALNVSS